MLPSIESIKQQRQKIGLTQKELANEVGVSTSMINRSSLDEVNPVMKLQKKSLRC